jgi:KDO2-lipid IV(A) lauroyltransferase
MLRALQDGGVVLGLLCDQHAGRKGMRIPFFGHECSTTLAPAKLAQKYQLPLFTAVCFRVGLGQWRIEMGKEIPTRIDGRLRPAGEVMSDVNGAFETAVRRDPANSFWVQDRWRFARGDREALRAARIQADQAENYSGNKPAASAPRA